MAESAEHEHRHSAIPYVVVWIVLLFFTGLTFVITGTLPTLSRDQAKAMIEGQGGTVTDSVSKKTSFLIVGAAAGSQLANATTLGIPKIDERTLRHKLWSHSGSRRRPV